MKTSARCKGPSNTDATGDGCTLAFSLLSAEDGTTVVSGSDDDVVTGEANNGTPLPRSGSTVIVCKGAKASALTSAAANSNKSVHNASNDEVVAGILVVGEECTCTLLTPRLCGGNTPAQCHHRAATFRSGNLLQRHVDFSQLLMLCRGTTITSIYML